MWIRGHSRSLKMVSFESLDVVSYSPSVVTMALSFIILEMKQDIGQKLRFFIPPCIWCPLLGGSPSVCCLSVWYGKTRMMGLPDGEKYQTICLPVLTECTNVTDRHTDTAWWLRPRLMQASRGKNDPANITMWNGSKVIWLLCGSRQLIQVVID